VNAERGEQDDLCPRCAQKRGVVCKAKPKINFTQQSLSCSNRPYLCDESQAQIGNKELRGKNLRARESARSGGRGGDACRLQTETSSGLNIC